MKHCVFFLLFSLLGFNTLEAQVSEPEDNTTEVIDTTNRHSPQLAAWMSAFVPGAGQFYNKKYWKIPLYYAAGAGLLYSTFYNSDNYHLAKKAYILALDGKEHPDFIGYDSEQLQSIKDSYRRYRDLSIIGLTLVYIINIVDATVDGYLFDYDVSDNLSLRVEPSIMNNYYQPKSMSAFQQFGLKCTVRF